jgi:hypothetical protein
MFRTAKRPGERVEETGVYWVHHYAHRISHPARLTQGDEFPRCRVCGEKVRFEKPVPQVQEIQQEAPPITMHTDFKKAA